MKRKVKKGRPTGKLVQRSESKRGINRDFLVYSEGGSQSLKSLVKNLKARQLSGKKFWLVVKSGSLSEGIKSEISDAGIELLEGDSIQRALLNIVQSRDSDGQLIMIGADEMPGDFNYDLFSSEFAEADKSGNRVFKISKITGTSFFPVVDGSGEFIRALLSKNFPRGKFSRQILRECLFTNVVKTHLFPADICKNKFRGVPGPTFLSRIRHLTIGALNDLRNGVSTAVPGIAESPAYRLIFFGWMLVALFGMTILSQNAGISGDEYRYIDQAGKVYNYFTSFGEDKSAVSQRGIDPQHYNAQSFDNLLFAVQKWIGIEADSFGFRHFWNAVIGWIAVLFTALIALRLGGGYRMALLAALLLVLSPRFLGHSYNNHRDIPMAAAVVFAFYWMIPFLKSLPRIDYKAALWVVLGIAAAYSLRLGGGVLLTGYLFVFAAIFYMTKHRPSLWFQSKQLASAGDIGIRVLAVAFLAYLIGLLSWPFGLEAPVRHTLEVLDATANIGVSLRQVFEGQEIFSSAMPWYYVPRYMQLTIPIVVLAAFLAGLAMIKKFATDENLPLVFMLIAAIVLPLIYACFFTTNHYGGWRHFIFIYPFVVLMGALGLEAVFRTRKKSWEPWYIWGLVAFGLFFPVRFIVQNHPYEYIYYNELIGGTGGAAGYYELDYSMNSLKGASAWLIDNVLKHHEGPEKLRIATNDRRATLHYLREYRDVADVVYTRYYEKSKADWDYATFYCSFISPYQIRAGLWPPEETLYSATVDGAVVGAVVRRVSKHDYSGHVKMDNMEPVEALVHFLQYLEKDPNSVEVWASIADAYLYIEEYEGALSAAEVALELMPGYGPVLEYKGGALLNLGRYREAVEAFDELLEDMPHYYVAQYFKAAALFRMGNYLDAIEAGRMAVGYNPDFRLGYQLLVECYRALGDHTTAEGILRQMEQRFAQ